MASIVFVHGTGVRGKDVPASSYERTLQKVHDGLSATKNDATLLPCSWGDEHGSRLLGGGASFGSPHSTVPNTADDDLAVWAQLDDDPLAELRVLAGAEPSAPPLPPHLPPRCVMLAEDLQELESNEQVMDCLTDSALLDVFPASIKDIVSAEPYVVAVDNTSPGGVICTAVVKSVVAQAQRLADGDVPGSAPVTGDIRDELVKSMVAALGGSDRFFGKLLAQASFELLLRSGLTRPVERRRAKIMDTGAPFAGDVVLYLTRGANIRGAIKKAIDSAPPPVTVLAHSLGGIASVDLLIAEALPQVSTLVTVGSQAPLLYELNALPNLEYGAALPDRFPRWINVVDPRDMLAYWAEPIFPGRVTDEVLDNKAPFPRSHSAYFTNEKLYRLLRAQR